MKAGIIGNTKLTYKVILFLLSKKVNIDYVFGLPDKKLKNKVNSFDLRPFCADNNIEYVNNNDWGYIADKKVDVVYEMGDSRIVPASFLQKNLVIGNHGAILPNVQGAASLVWGKTLNSGQWGVSLMELNEQIDGGDILVTKEILYDTEKTTMNEFVEMCDNATVECIQLHFEGNYKRTNNSSWQVKVAKNIDSKAVVQVLGLCLQNNINVYLPPRRPVDAKLDDSWGPKFIENFKIANSYPYPSYYGE